MQFLVRFWFWTQTVMSKLKEKIIGFFSPSEKDLENLTETIHQADNAVEEELAQHVPLNPVDKAIVAYGQGDTTNEVYQARWVWYHTILAGLMFLTVVLLIGVVIEGVHIISLLSQILAAQ